MEEVRGGVGRSRNSQRPEGSESRSPVVTWGTVSQTQGTACAKAVRQEARGLGLPWSLGRAAACGLAG